MPIQVQISHFTSLYQPRLDSLHRVGNELLPHVMRCLAGVACLNATALAGVDTNIEECGLMVPALCPAKHDRSCRDRRRRPGSKPCPMPPVLAHFLHKPDHLPDQDTIRALTGAKLDRRDRHSSGTPALLMGRAAAMLVHNCGSPRIITSLVMLQRQASWDCLSTLHSPRQMGPFPPLGSRMLRLGSCCGDNALLA